VYVDEWLERKKQHYDPELVYFIETELDLMINNGRLVVPLFCSFISADNAKEGSKNRIYLLNIAKNDKIKKNCSFDISSFEAADLFVIIKTIYEFILSFSIEYVNPNKIKTKLTELEQKISGK